MAEHSMLNAGCCLGLGQRLFEDPQREDRPEAPCGPLQCVNYRTTGAPAAMVGVLVVSNACRDATFILGPLDIKSCRAPVSILPSNGLGGQSCGLHSPLRGLGWFACTRLGGLEGLNSECRRQL